MSVLRRVGPAGTWERKKYQIGALSSLWVDFNFITDLEFGPRQQGFRVSTMVMVITSHDVAFFLQRGSSRTHTGRDSITIHELTISINYSAMHSVHPYSRLFVRMS